MNMWANNIFYVIFLGQILLTSYWVPKVILSRTGALMDKYPPSTHAKLYPKPIEYYRRGQAIFKWANRVILMLGFVVLYAAYALDHGTFARNGNISDALPAAYGVIQFLPLMAMELMGFHQFKLMREANTSRTRKAELRPRRLLDVLSPGLLAMAVVAFLGVIGFDLAMNDFKLVWGSDAVQRELVMAGTNGLLAALGLWYLLGRKLDPYQASPDRVRQVRVQLNSLFLVSTTLSLYLIFQTADDVFDLGFLKAPLMSLYFQLMVVLSIGYVLRAINPADVDFSVYADNISMENN